jgi:hypothetical protein
MSILAHMHPYHFTATDQAENVSEFLALCRSHRHVAREHLAAGWFEPWLRDQGRTDLATRAARVRTESDGLEQFLRTARPTPRRTARAA